VNSLYGTRVAVLAGDFLFAESSAGLAQLDNLEVRIWWTRAWLQNDALELCMDFHAYVYNC
jgi:geranylgeranyl pyrophosphate synthase